ncbi:hypothetical protein BLNAU_10748 [Blattamonas nauphoetae]|uniref:Uncharacterized protein n=1 Tax=Blattamonas nauphoetae TaxID=2049346 RepID=A0ABQ9XSI8_9EUKA|nr:hypothetical protein BLNAU_10748 [Blattamonas nauphoetae]
MHETESGVVIDPTHAGARKDHAQTGCVVKSKAETVRTVGGDRPYLFLFWKVHAFHIVPHERVGNNPYSIGSVSVVSELFLHHIIDALHSQHSIHWLPHLSLFSPSYVPFPLDIDHEMQKKPD